MPRDELANRRACGGDLRRAPKHRSLQEAAAPETDTAVPDVVERDQLAAGYVDDSRHTQQSSESDGQRPQCVRPRRHAQPETALLRCSSPN